jgi:hypothetical protein
MILREEGDPSEQEYREKTLRISGVVLSASQGKKTQVKSKLLTP